MLQLSLTTDHALRAMLHIARQGGRVVVREELGRTLDLPPKSFGNMLKTLVLGKLLYSFRGTGGGFTLTRPAGEITLREVVEAIEGRITVNGCQRDETSCRLRMSCGVHDVWRRVQEQVLARLDGVTLAHLLESSGGCRQEPSPGSLQGQLPLPEPP